MTAQVGIVMGSDSDMPVMRKAASILDQFGVPYEIEILSAHRTPDLVALYGEAAEDRGIKVIVAGAGLSAALPGALAATSTVPVVGVPIASGPLEGIDALLSIVQVPISVPVATVGIGNGRNAALFAVQVLARSDPELAKAYREYKKSQWEAVLEKRRTNEINGEYIDGLLEAADRDPRVGGHVPGSPGDAARSDRRVEALRAAGRKSSPQAEPDPV